ncbi:heavy metal-associated domain-containing protein [Flavobacterium branchiarum]|uniref:Heavy-metal-associated domain-containing protein n=1 Tax=Flavobacterium branchiarum TaxID=1114870 RepID=A0ABV5FH22_9FLAO|nr:heavy metal-associated domain-containing protein [Flavobacterium branchiarum]MDN3671769.1 heavy metal-associated domain-containing protein [Flavobacterium branchiarum]
MKIVKSIAVIAIASLLFISCKKNETETTPVATTEAATPKVHKEIAAQNVQTASFEIEGMTCAMGCAKTIESELADLDGVQDAKVDFDKKTATVTFDKTVQNPDNLTKIVQATGDGKTYKVSNMKS